MVRVTPRLSFKLKFINYTELYSQQLIYLLRLYPFVFILNFPAERNHLIIIPWCV
jgi:hypothetical protein